MDAIPIPLETLLAHRDWVRAVARAVVLDPNTADDVEQDTWLAALRAPPRHHASIRGWLGAVVRNRARKQARGESRREARETAASRAEATASAAEIAETADLHRRVVQAVVELDEPYRATILLRYFEGLSIEDVAARTASPVETTRSRVKRGIAKLRERLAREFGDDRPPALALAPLLGAIDGSAPRAAPTTAAGVATATTSVAVVAVLFIAAVAGWMAVDGSSTASPGMDTASAGVHAAPVETSDVAASGRDPAAPSAPARSPQLTDASTRTPAPSAPTGHFVEVIGDVEKKLKAPVEPFDFRDDPPLVVLGRIAEATGVPIVVSAEATDRLAKFEKKVGVYHASSGNDLVTSIMSYVDVGLTIWPDRVVVTPSDGKWDPDRPMTTPPVPPPVRTITVVGRVTDAAGAPVAGAVVGRRPPCVPRTTTDAAGRYELTLRPPYYEIQASIEGRVPSCAGVVGEPGSRTTVDFVLGDAAGEVNVRLVGLDAGSHAFVRLGTPCDVEVTLPDGRKVMSCRSSFSADAAARDGVARFSQVPPGEITVRTDVPGFADAKTTTKVVAGEVAEVELRLAKLAPLSERFERTRVTAELRQVGIDEVLTTLQEASGISTMRPTLLGADGRKFSFSWSATPLGDAYRDICRELGGFEYDLNDEIDCVNLRRPEAK